MGALQPDEVTIYIVASVDADYNDLISGNDVTVLLNSYSESGGEKDTESFPMFGGANLEKEMPRSQIEVAFDCVVQYGSNATKFDEYRYGSTLKSSGDGVGHTIVLHWTDGTNDYYRAYNNARAVTWEPGMETDGFLQGTLTFKLNPTDEAGIANLIVDAADPTDATDGLGGSGGESWT